MPLPFPYPMYGYLYDSNGDILASGTIIANSGNKALTMTSNSIGKYVDNLMDYAYSGCTMTVNADGKGETYSSTFKLVVSDMGKNLNITLEEANLVNDISLNTYRKYGNEVYIFNSNIQKGHLKTIDYD